MAGIKLNILFWKNIKKTLLNREIANKTQYLKKGFTPVIDKIINALKFLQIEYRLDEEIKEINIKNKIVYLKTSNYNLKSKNLVISHGFIPPKKFLIDGNLIQIFLKKHPRPSLHIISKNQIIKDLNKRF